MCGLNQYLKIRSNDTFGGLEKVVERPFWWICQLVRVQTLVQVRNAKCIRQQSMKSTCQSNAINGFFLAFNKNKMIAFIYYILHIVKENYKRKLMKEICIYRCMLISYYIISKDVSWCKICKSWILKAKQSSHHVLPWEVEPVYKPKRLLEISIPGGKWQWMSNL